MSKGVSANSKSNRRISLAGRQVDFKLVCSRSASKLRVRVGTSGVEVVRPKARDEEAVKSFLLTNGLWIINQLDRIERFRGIRRAKELNGQILFRGEPVRVRVATHSDRKGPTQIFVQAGEICLERSASCKTPASRSLENWFRKEARKSISNHLERIAPKLNRQPGRILVMGQRTKWGNCSPLKNLSFNWRLVLAPSFVLEYLVTHETVHLAIPDHSQKFWLAVRSYCPETERAKQWLSANGHQLMVDLKSICGA